MAYTTVLFDLDHTLLDSDESERLAFSVTMQAFGVAEPSDHLRIYREINRELWASVERGERTPNDVKTLRFEQLIDLLDLAADPIEVADRYTGELGANGSLYPGVPEMLDEVGRSARLALVTNGIGSVQRARIDRLGLDDHVSAVAISGELGVSKPDAAIFDHVFAGLGGPDRSSAIIVGDSLTSDMAGGHNAGIATCWYNPHGAVTTEPTPTLEVRSIDEIAPALRRGG